MERCTSAYQPALGIMMANRSPPQQEERRGGPSQHAIELGVNLASAYLAPTSLAALCTCSRAMKELASADAVWSAHTLREYPWSVHLRTVGGACAVVGRREFVRLRKMSERHVTKGYPGVEAYSALVVIEDRGATVVEGLFDIDETNGELSINVLPNNEKLCVDFELLEEEKEMTISVVLVRKIDGKCMQLLSNATTEYVDEDYLIFREGISLTHGNGRPYSIDIVMEEISVERTDGERVLTGWERLMIDSWDNSAFGQLETSQLLREWADSDTWI